MKLNGLFKNRTMIGMACIMLSLLICFGLTPLFNGVLTAETEIVRVTKDIRKGDALTADNTELVKVGAFNLPDNVVKNINLIQGKYAVADLVKGDYILPSKLTDKPYEENEYLYKLDGRKQAISVSIKGFALGLSGKLKAGDIVTVIASDYGDERQTLIPPELNYVKVLAATTEKGGDESAAEKSDKNGDKNEEKQLPSTVTLLADPTQAKVLADLEAKSKIHIALVYRGNEENANKFIQAQDSVLPQPEALSPTSTAVAAVTSMATTTGTVAAPLNPSASATYAHPSSTSTAVNPGGDANAQ